MLGTYTDDPGLWVFDRESGQIETLVDGDLVWSAGFHPSGRWIVYSLGWRTQWDVWVRPFPGPGEPSQLTFDGGREPRFSADGSELFYRSPSQMMAMSIEISGQRLVHRPPEPLFEDGFAQTNAGASRNYDVDSTSGRFLMIEGGEEAEPERVVLVQNWRAKVIQKFSEGEIR